MKKTKIKDGKRVWANEEFVQQFQERYEVARRGHGRDDYFLKVWVKELLVDELGFRELTSFFILVDDKQTPSIALTVRWENGFLVIPQGDPSLTPTPIHKLKDLLHVLREEWAREVTWRRETSLD